MNGNAYIPFMRSRGDGSTLNLDFTGGSLDPRVVLTRSAATATYINSSGYVASAAVNEARFDYDPTTLAAKGLLIEGSATNYLLRSTTCTSTGWNTGGTVTVTTSYATGPDGVSNSATRFQMNHSGGGTGRIYQDSGFTTKPYTNSVWIKSNTGSNQTLNLWNTAGSGNTFTITATPTWQRFENVNTTGTSLAGYFYLENPSTNPAVVVDVLIYGAQLEAGTSASSYIPTTTAQVTRNPDLALMTSTNFSSWYTGGTTGTFFVDFHGGVRGITSTIRTVISTNDQTTKHLHLQQASAAGVLKVADFGAAHSVSTANTITSGARTKGAFNFDGATTTVNLCLNGGTVATSSAIAFSVAPTWLALGATSTDGSTLTDLTTVLNGSIRQIKYYPTALTSAQLIAMTT
jgi:hypothetical protein